MTDDDRAELESLDSARSHSAQKGTQGHILLKPEQGWSDPKIAETLDCGRTTDVGSDEPWILGVRAVVPS